MVERNGGEGEDEHGHKSVGGQRTGCRERCPLMYECDVYRLTLQRINSLSFC